MLRCSKFLISHFVPAESSNIEGVREITVHLAYSLLLYVCIPKLGMTLRGSTNLCDSEHMTQWHFVCFMSCEVDSGRHKQSSTEERFVARVWWINRQRRSKDEVVCDNFPAFIFETISSQSIWLCVNLSMKHYHAGGLVVVFQISFATGMASRMYHTC
jgi:hypothetical protein